MANGACEVERHDMAVTNPRRSQPRPQSHSHRDQRSVIIGNLSLEPYFSMVFLITKRLLDDVMGKLDKGTSNLNT